MQRIRIQKKPHSLRFQPGSVLPLDARDPDVLRVKEAMRRHPSSANRASTPQGERPGATS